MLRSKMFAIFIANLLIIAQLLFSNATCAYASNISTKDDFVESGNYKLSGYIKPSFNSTNNVLAGFLVEVEKTQLSTKTDVNGYFEIYNDTKLEFTAGSRLQKLTK